MKLKKIRIMISISFITCMCFASGLYFLSEVRSLKAQTGGRTCLMAARTSPNAGARSYACAEMNGSLNGNWCSEFSSSSNNDPGVRYKNTDFGCSNYGFTGTGTPAKLGVFWTCTNRPGDPMECPQIVKDTMFAEIGF